MIGATTIQRYATALRSLSYAFDTTSLDFLADTSGVIAWIEYQPWAISSKTVSYTHLTLPTKRIV